MVIKPVQWQNETLWSPMKARALSPAHLNISPFPIQSTALSALVWIKELLGIPSESILYVRLGRVCERVYIFVMCGFHSLKWDPLKGIAHQAVILMLMCAQPLDHRYLRSEKKGSNLCLWKVGVRVRVPNPPHNLTHTSLASYIVHVRLKVGQIDKDVISSHQDYNIA